MSEDRYDKQAEILCSTKRKEIAAALRQAESSALERAAQEADAEAAEYHADAKKLDAAGRTDAGTKSVHGELGCRAVAKRIRALIPPAAPPAVETGKAQVAFSEDAIAIATYHEDRARWGGDSQEFHERAASFLRGLAARAAPQSGDKP